MFFIVCIFLCLKLSTSIHIDIPDNLIINCTFTTNTLACYEEIPQNSTNNNSIDIQLNNFIFNLTNIAVNVKILNLSGLNISKISSDLFEKFPNLEYVDLRNNNLDTFLEPRMLPENLTTILMYNNKWNCSKNVKWALRLKSKTSINDIENLTCSSEAHFGKPLLEIAVFLDEIETTCTESCNCTLPKVVRNPETGILEPIVEVNCSYRGFTELPAMLPAKTKILHLEGNEIESLRPIRESMVYKKILDLYVDNNLISTLEVLEGSYWLTHFRVFSLRGNKLSELPTYALDNALERNVNMPNAVRLSLGANPWKCDCVFTPAFQEMLQKYAEQIKDINDIKCSYVEGDENSLLPIIEISRTSVCPLPTEYSVQDALDLLNAVLASLIIFVLGKLAYDYYYFKKTGRLPWIVTKLP